MGDNATYRGCRTSALQEARRCPFACQKTYRDKLVGGTNEPAAMGGALHDLLEDYGNHCLTHKYDTDYDYFNSIYVKYAVKAPSNMYQDALRVARALKEATNFGEGIAAKAAFVERRIFIDIHGNCIDGSDPDEVYFASGIDYYYITETAECTKAYIEDYKSYRRISTKSESDANLQRKLYPLLVFLAHPEVEEIEFRFNYIRYNFLGLPYRYTRDDVPELMEELRASAERFYELMEMKEDAEARPSGFCPLCPVFGLCEAAQNSLPESAIVKSEAEAAELVRAHLAHSLAVKKVSSVLKNYVEHNGDVKLSDTEVYGVTVVHGEEIDDMLGLVNFLLTEKGAKRGAIFDSIKFKSKKAMDRLLSDCGATEKEVEKFFSPKKKTRVEYKDKIDHNISPDDEDE